MSWTVHPAARRPLEALAVAGVVLLFALLATEFAGSGLLGAVSALLLAVALRSYFLPRSYRLDASGATERGPLQHARRLDWSEVRRVVRDRHGVHLSTLHSRSRWLRDRGLFLRADENLDAVCSFARQHACPR